MVEGVFGTGKEGLGPGWLKRKNGESGNPTLWRNGMGALRQGRDIPPAPHVACIIISFHSISLHCIAFLMAMPVEPSSAARGSTR